MVGTAPNFLVGIETNANVAMLNLVVVAQETHGLHNLGNAGFVVGTQQSGAIGDDNVFANMRLQLGKFGHRGDLSGRERDVVAVIISNDARLHVLATGIRTRVIMRNKTDGGHLFLGVSLQGGIDIAHLVHLDIAQALVLELFFQVAGKV